MYKGYYIKKIRFNRGYPRIWLDGSALERAGFLPGQKYVLLVKGNSLVAQVNPMGGRSVTPKKVRNRVIPVMDINSNRWLKIFQGMTEIRVMVRRGIIYLLPLASELKKRDRRERLMNKLKSGEPLTWASLAGGGGIMTAALHAGLAAAGLASTLAMVNEVRPELIEHAAQHNPAWSRETAIYNAPMQELAIDVEAMDSLPDCDLLEIGIVCSGASKSGLAARKLKRAEQHPEAGALVASYLPIMARVNPFLMVLECVPSFANTASADILRSQLKGLGYVLHERVMNGREWGALEARERWVCIVVDESLPFNFNALVAPALPPRPLKNCLETVPADDPRWSEMAGLKAKELRDRAKANSNFKMQIVHPDDTKIGVLAKGYAKVRSTEPKLAHPSIPGLLRQLSAKEHARVKGVPEDLIADLPETLAHQVLGQGVIFPLFVAIGQYIGLTLLKQADSPAWPLAA